MAQVFKDAARSALGEALSAQATQLSILMEHAQLFPAANVGAAQIASGAGDWFKLVVQDAQKFEIVYVRSYTPGTTLMFNLLRGQEGTQAQSFEAGAVVGLRVTARDMTDAAAPVTWSGVQGKPSVIAAGASQHAARQAIGAGTSSLELGTTATTAKRGDWQPQWNGVQGKPGVIAAGLTQRDARNAIDAVEDAPAGGAVYGRRRGAWAPVSAGVPLGAAVLFFGGSPLITTPSGEVYQRGGTTRVFSSVEHDPAVPDENKVMFSPVQVSTQNREQIQHLAVATGSYAYAIMQPAKVFLSNNAGVSWTHRSDGPAGLGQSDVLDVCASPDGKVYLVTRKGVFYSSDWGITWVSVGVGSSIDNGAAVWAHNAAWVWDGQRFMRFDGAAHTILGSPSFGSGSAHLSALDGRIILGSNGAYMGAVQVYTVANSQWRQSVIYTGNTVVAGARCFYVSAVNNRLMWTDDVAVAGQEVPGVGAVSNLSGVSDGVWGEQGDMRVFVRSVDLHVSWYRGDFRVENLLQWGGGSSVTLNARVKAGGVTLAIAQRGVVARMMDTPQFVVADPANVGNKLFAYTRVK